MRGFPALLPRPILSGVHCARWRPFLAGAALLSTLGLPPAAFAQALPGPTGGEAIGPGRDRVPLPEPRSPDQDDPALALPPLPAPARPDAGGLRIFVERFEVRGSTVFDAATLEATVAPFRGREIVSEELLAARDAVTRLYVDAGYVTSGAIVPDQPVDGGVIVLQVIEGALAEVEVRGHHRFRPGYFETRLLRAGAAPVHVNDLENALRRLQRDPRIARVDALLEPAAQRGASRLILQVEENPFFHVGGEVGNTRSPAIGSDAVSADVAVYNLAGWGDTWSLQGDLAEGLRSYEARVSVPITPWDTTLSVRLRESWVEIVERPFERLDIESRARTWGVELYHPLFRDDLDEVWLGVIGDLRTLDTQVAGVEFCFEPNPGLGGNVIGCSDPRASIVRASLSWTRRTPRNVVAFRGLVSHGVDAFNASRRSSRALADGRFWAGLLQLQWAHVLPPWLLESHLVTRADLQLASETLLSFERFAIGGRTSVRGYRENQLVTDSGVTASAELRVPIWRDGLGRHRLEVVPFMDFGQGWNAEQDPVDDLLWSGGVGLRAMPVEGLFAEAWWGGQLERIDDPNRVLQDRGFHLRVRVDVP